MFPIFNLGPLAIQAPGLIILVGIYISFLVIEKQPKIFKGSANDLSNAKSGRSRTVIPGHAAHLFRSMSHSDSGVSRKL